LGYPEQFTIYDRGDQETVARGALRDIRVGHQTMRPSDLINMISNWKGKGMTAAQAEQNAAADDQLLGAMAYGRYQASLKASGAMDFDDLLLLTSTLFQEFPEARYAEASRFDHLLIDEYQDTNGLQYGIVKALAERHRNICVVGDDDQSIYGWRGAEVEHILGFKDQWPDARVVRLEDNYRSTEWVIHLANQLIAHNKKRHDKVLKAARERGAPPRFHRFEDENAEAESVVHDIFRRINREDHERVPASQIAILFRTNEQPRVFEQELRRAGVPYRLVGGQSFFDRKEIKDLLSYLRTLANPHDEVSLLRILNTPPRGIGTSSVQTLLDEAVAAGEPLWKSLPAASAHPGVTEKAGVAIENFRLMMEEFQARIADESLSSLFAELVERVNYRAELQRQYKDPTEQETRWNAVEELVNAISQYEERDENPSLLGFLEASALDTQDDDDDDKQEHAITLMTLHSAKGLEFPIVYLVGLEEGLLPHKRTVIDPDKTAIDEERRLAYVGVTRAQDELLLSYCRGRMKWGKLRPQVPSRFLMEMRGETEKANELAAAGEKQIRQEVAKADEFGGKKKSKKKRSAQKKDKKREAKTPATPAQKPAALEMPRVSDLAPSAQADALSSPALASPALAREHEPSASKEPAPAPEHAAQKAVSSQEPAEKEADDTSNSHKDDTRAQAVASNPPHQNKRRELKRKPRPNAQQNMLEGLRAKADQANEPVTTQAPRPAEQRIRAATLQPPTKVATAPESLSPSSTATSEMSSPKELPKPKVSRKKIAQKKRQLSLFGE
ncbi:MAG: UvrD-helicase domain-containing protein, partial [Polyangiaceae bacterium]|nr:UvrD-helicase domain-containing protein [Polyangiaceae bacterium]